MKVQLMVFMKALHHQKDSLLSIFVSIRANTKFCLRLNYNGENSYLFVNAKEIFKFKADNKNVQFSKTFQFNFMSKEFSASEYIEACLNGSKYDFSDDYKAIEKLNILNVHQYLIIKNDM